MRIPNDQAASSPGIGIGVGLQEKVEVGTREVVVQPGDTVGDLIVRHVGDFTPTNLERIVQLNNSSVVDVDLLSPGQVVTVPILVSYEQYEQEQNAKAERERAAAEQQERERRRLERQQERERQRQARREAIARGLDPRLVTDQQQQPPQQPPQSSRTKQPPTLFAEPEASEDDVGQMGSAGGKPMKGKRAAHGDEDEESLIPQLQQDFTSTSDAPSPVSG